jgi:K+-transporting ATPase A subunit
MPAPSLSIEGPNYENAIVAIGHLERMREMEFGGGGGMGGSNSSTPYENLNMDHISRLTTEGFAQDLVIRALGITRNDIDMARDILTEFGSARASNSS